MERWLPVFEVGIAAVAALAATLAVGDTGLSRFYILQDDSGDDDWSAQLRIDADDAGHLEWICWPDHASALEVTVYESRTADQQEVGNKESVRFRIDWHPARSTTVETYDMSAEEAFDGRAYTFTGQLTATRGFVDELGDGQRLIAQVGSLRILSFDLATANPDIVKFRNFCERAYEKAWTPGEGPRSWSEYGRELRTGREGEAPDSQSPKRP